MAALSSDRRPLGPAPGYVETHGVIELLEQQLAALIAERDALRAQLAPTWIPVDESKRIMCACPDEGCYRAVEWDGTNLTIYVDVSEFDAGLPSLFTMIDLPENVRLCELTPPA